MIAEPTKSTVEWSNGDVSSSFRKTKYLFGYVVVEGSSCMTSEEIFALTWHEAYNRNNEIVHVSSFLFLLNFIHPKLALGCRSERPMSNDRTLVDAIPLKDRLFSYRQCLRRLTRKYCSDDET